MRNDSFRRVPNSHLKTSSPLSFFSLKPTSEITQYAIRSNGPLPPTHVGFLRALGFERPLSTTSPDTTDATGRWLDYEDASMSHKEGSPSLRFPALPSPLPSPCPSHHSCPSAPATKRMLLSMRLKTLFATSPTPTQPPASSRSSSVSPPLTPTVYQLPRPPPWSVSTAPPDSFEATEAKTNSGQAQEEANVSSVGNGNDNPISKPQA